MTCCAYSCTQYGLHTVRSAYSTVCIQYGLYTVRSAYTVHAANPCWCLAVPTAAHSTVSCISPENTKLTTNLRPCALDAITPCTGRSAKHCASTNMAETARWKLWASGCATAVPLSSVDTVLTSGRFVVTPLVLPLTASISLSIIWHKICTARIWQILVVFSRGRSEHNMAVSYSLVCRR
jgi:hypothetical protein